MSRDVVGLENEKYETPLLKKVINKGVLARKLPDNERHPYSNH